MKYDFSQVIERNNTLSIKYDFAKERKKPSGLLSLWVADMDFPVAQEIKDALIERCNHGIFGYSEVKTPYYEVIAKWYQEKFNWSTKKQWLVKTPGVVAAIANAIRAFTNIGDAVLIQKPVYYPFFLTIEDNQRKVVNNSLVYKNGRYEMDFVDFEEKIISHKVKLFVLCSPHNPVGRVWNKEELLKLGDICLKHKVIVVADEIHADFVYQGHQHQVFANLKTDYQEITVTCTAPSKTFNIAGLQVSNIFIANENLRKKFKQELKKTANADINVMGLIACQAAYSQGEDWLRQVKIYIAENLEYVKTFLRDNLPQVKLVEPEGTYLLWLDFRELNLTEEELEDLIINKAKLWLDGGTMFGTEGVGFQRINIACPQKILIQAFTQLKEALKQ
ncbi:MAG: pyridoxal phosphate-dependent aminotransferase [Negativicutes bacterium]|nr:pyridoxal phosphate-dependent aminotransferase [Negativicutes bacterium]MBP8629768.1 pyridoxal phosphate-dependent aminotransferase [Negativicutes bacterium]MBP9949938.1 pyridoxal phosphate-dependent aminotransferase [Negativicutes bacterium]